MEILELVLDTPGKHGRRHAADLRGVVDAMLYIAQTGCQWRYLPESFGGRTRVWSQFRRWSRNGTWARSLTVRPARDDAMADAARCLPLSMSAHRHDSETARREARTQAAT